VSWQRRIQRIAQIGGRVPWLLPLSSFIAGWIGFVMVQRGASLARVMALVALLGWPWLLIEPVVRRAIERRKPRLGNFVVNFVSQSLQQELLFFSLPFLIGATQVDTGQVVFTGLAASAAVLSTIDPLYEHYVASRAARRLLFHAYCSWIAALVVLPMVLLLPLERALPISLAAVAAWLLLTLPLSLYSLRATKLRVAWVIGVLLVPPLLWAVRGQVPPAGLAVTEARITQSIESLTPGAPVRQVSRADLANGVIAFAAIRAPAGLSQSVIFQWRHNGKAESIAAEIHGGNEQGFRTFSRKRIFPEDAEGTWTVDVLTPQGQLLKRLRFVVAGEPRASG
jgi:hypothetical protein